MKIPKNLLSSVLPFIISISLFIIVGKFGIEKVSALRAEINQGRLDKTVLTEKLNNLRTLSTDAANGSQVTASALPDRNSALAVLSQVKLFASQNTLTVSNLKSGAETKEAGGLSRADVSFDVTGPKEGILAFLKLIEKSAPLSLIDKLKLNDAAGQVRATVTVKAFWAPFPEKLPEITQALATFSDEENNTLLVINSLTQPQFTELTPTEGGRENPFTE